MPKRGKPPMFNGRRVTCCYCRRQVEAPTPEVQLSLTWDHMRPESDGGWKRFPCCRQCNQLKDNIPPEDWFWFIGAHPGYWRTFTHPNQVRQVIREFRFSQAQAGQRPYRVKGCRLPNLVAYRGKDWQ